MLSVANKPSMLGIIMLNVVMLNAVAQNKMAESHSILPLKPNIA
jgi:hypothetical protein